MNKGKIYYKMYYLGHQSLNYYPTSDNLRDREYVWFIDRDNQLKLTDYKKTWSLTKEELEKGE